MDNFSFNISFKHEVLRDVFREALLKGDYKPGERFPSQNELCEKYGVAINTVREAVTSLVNEKLLIRVQGKGTFVADIPVRYLSLSLIMDGFGYGFNADFRATTDVNVHLMHYVHDEALKSKIGVLLCLDNQDIEQERVNIRQSIDRGVDGAIIFYIGGEQNLDCLEELRANGIPFVLIHRMVSGFNCDYVVADEYPAAKTMTESMIDRGFDKIIFLTYSFWPHTGGPREMGYRDALAGRGLSENEMVVPMRGTERLDLDNCRAIVRNAVESVGSSRVGLFFDHSGLISLAWPAIEASGLKYEDLALACFDSFPLEWLPHDMFITRAISSFEDMARTSVRLLMDKINGRREIQQIMLRPLIEVFAPESKVK